MDLNGLRAVVRGAGDIGSAVAHRLFREACAVVIHEDPKPTTTRRGMAFADAVFDGRTRLDDRRCAGPPPDDPGNPTVNNIREGSRGGFKRSASTVFVAPELTPASTPATPTPTERAVPADVPPSTMPLTFLMGALS